jgi:hypothetical protein
VPTFSQVFPKGKTARLIGPDAYFHLRHVKNVVAHYPFVTRDDKMTNFPGGERGLNQGFFDVTVATIVKVTGGLLSPLVALAWVSPICMLLIGMLGYLWILGRVNERTAALYLLFLLLYPAPLKAVAAMGHGDHHAAEVLLALLVAWSLEHLLQPETSWRWAPVAVAPIFFFYLAWAGTPLHLFLVGLCFYVRAWKPDDQDPSLARKGALYGATLLAALMLLHLAAPWAVIWDVSERLFSLGAICLCLGYPLLVKVARRPWSTRWLVAVGLVAMAFLATYLTPTGHAALSEMFESRTRQIAEHTPISMNLLLTWFGFLWIVALLAPLRIWQRKAFWTAMVPLLYGGSLVLFWAKTYDFDYYTPAVLAAAAAYTLGTLAWSTTLAWTVALLAAMPLLPKVMEKPWLDRKVVRDIILYSDGLDAASTWLREVQGPPKPQDQRDYGLVAPWDLGNILADTADTPVAFSETVSRELANMVYSDDPEASYKAMMSRKKPLKYILLPARNLGEKFLGEMGAADLKIEEMFVRGRKVEWKGRKITLLEPSERNKRALLCRLYWGMGKNLGHFRLVYETPEQVLQLTKLLSNGSLEFYAWPVSAESLLTGLKPLLDHPETPQETNRGVMVGARQAAEVRIFEAVPGALLVGKARPGDRIQAELDLSAPTSFRRWTCSWATTADKDGNYSLRVPYSTTAPLNAVATTVKVRGPYKILVGGRLVVQNVSEAEVQQELKVALPN